MHESVSDNVIVGKILGGLSKILEQGIYLDQEAVSLHNNKITHCNSILDQNYYDDDTYLMVSSILDL